MTIAAIRAGLASALGDVSGLRVSAYQLDQVNPPQAEVRLDSIEYDLTFARGADIYRFVVTAAVTRTAERHAQELVDSYADGAGASSFKAALEADSTLGGVCDYARVTAMRGIEQGAVGDIPYLLASFEVEVCA